MKRAFLHRQDGYILAVVMVTITIASFLSVWMYIQSVQAVQMQEASFVRTKNRYEAEGKIEQAWAKVRLSDSVQYDDREQEIPPEIFLQTVQETISTVCECSGYTIVNISEEGGTAEVSVKAICGNVTVDAVWQMEYGREEIHSEYGYENTRYWVHSLQFHSYHVQ